MAHARAHHPPPEPSPFGPGNPDRPSLGYLFLRFLRHGLLAWGGPVAQIGRLHHETVARDGWVDEARFRKTLALYQALPGPEATELSVYFGMLKRGRWGGFMAGLGFVLPGLVLVTLLAALYVRYAATSDVAALLLYGVKPVVVALVAVAFVRLARASADTVTLGAVALGAAVVGILAPASLLLILLVGGLLNLMASRLRPKRSDLKLGAFALPLLLGPTFPALSATGLGALALLSAKVGLLTFGGAYTAIPFLYESAVVDHGWITEAQFLDALALSQMVPGPLIAIATFVGYQAAGLAGALLATLLVFTPAFGFTLVGHGLFERLVDEPRLHAFLLGVTAAVVGLIAVAVVGLAEAAFTDAWTLLLGLAAAALFLHGKVPTPLVVVGGALAGVAVQTALA